MEREVVEIVERKLATVRVIDAVEPINGADAIEVATVGGWKVVVRKGEYKAGDLAVYLEIDSWVPHELAPFLSNGKEPREYDGVKGERLRTIKLRGQISQGLLLSLDDEMKGIDDLTARLNIKKWERPMSKQLAGMARGNFPEFIRKTDQERCQNISDKIALAYSTGHEFEVTEKLDGSSMTAYFNEGLIGVCSRNIDLKVEDSTSAFVRTATEIGLLRILETLGLNVAIQGELYGEGIQGNKENIKGLRFAVFDIFDIDGQRYLTPEARQVFFAQMVRLGFAGEHATVIQSGKLPSILVDDLLTFAEGKNRAGKEREGVVFKSVHGDFSFKAISNKFLLKGGE